MARFKHTPEPWRLNEHEDVILGGSDDDICADWVVSATPNGTWGATESRPWSSMQEREDFKRIVQCVNACEGMENPKLFIAGTHQAALELKKLLAQIIAGTNIGDRYHLSFSHTQVKRVIDILKNHGL